MANLVTTTLIISGSNKQNVARFIAHLEGEDTPIDFEKISPKPLGFETKFDCDQESRTAEGEWNRQNWGTRSTAWCARRESSSGEVIYHFDTAWSPPTGIVDTLREEFPEVQIEAYFDDHENCETGTF